MWASCAAATTTSQQKRAEHPTSWRVAFVLRVNLTSSDPLPIFVYLPRDTGMKIVNSLKSLKKRDKSCRIVRRKGRVYVINKANPRYKARQG